MFNFPGNRIAIRSSISWNEEDGQAIWFKRPSNAIDNTAKSGMSKDSNADRKRQWVIAMLEKHERPLLNYALRVACGDQQLAQDAVQHAYLKLCDEEPAEIDHRVAPWLYAVCRNKVIDELRRCKRISSVDDQDIGNVASRIPPPDEVIAQRDDRVQLSSMIEQLPQGQREAIELWAQGFSYREIAEVCAKSEGAIRIQVHRAIGLLKRHPKIHALDHLTS